jgi:hypothetical protein
VGVDGRDQDARRKPIERPEAPERSTIVEEHQLVMERIRDLEGWAEYIVDALFLNQRFEPVGREMLERLLQERELQTIRELSWKLRDKLHLVRTQLELSRPAQPAMA